MKVIIHLGFPKTASSTLQFGPFADLERSKKLSLFTWRKEDPSELLEFRPSSRLFLEKDILPEYLNFSRHKLNVLSDESFTAPLRLRTLNFGTDIISPFSFPKMIRAQISKRFPDDEIDVYWLGVIRNQRDLIQSQYVEEYNWKRFKGIDLLFNSQGEVDLEGYEVYRFSDYISSLKETCDLYGDKFRFLMYEDMFRDPLPTCEFFDSLFGSKCGFFLDSFKSQHVNKKHKSVHGTFLKDGSYFVPALPDTVGVKIAEAFYESNEKLQQFFNVEKLKEYGYVRA
jgi:hypothetical protein